MKPNRRSFFASLLAAPAVGMAVAVAKPVEPPRKPPLSFNELLHDAHVLLGTIQPGQSLCQDDIEFGERILRDSPPQGPYILRVQEAALMLMPFYNVAQAWKEDGRIFYQITDPIPFDPDWPSGMTLTQTMTREEFKRRYPDADAPTF